MDLTSDWMEGREEEMNGSQKRTELSQQKKISQVAKQKARSVSAVTSIGWPVRYIVLDFIEMRVEMPGKMTVCVCVCHEPVIIRHSLCSSASVNSRETMSSGLMTNLISSWTRPFPVTPPPTNLFAKST